MAYLISEKEKGLILEISDKFQIARNIIVNCGRNYHPKKEIDQLVSHYSGVKLSTVQEVLNMKMTKRMTFLNWYSAQTFNKQQQSPMPSKESYELFRKIIIDLYVNKLTVPTLNKIEEALKSENVFLTQHQLATDLKRNGYLWKRLPKSKKHIIVENTKQVYSRMSYLYRIRQYRQNNRAIFYFQLCFNEKRHHIVLGVAPTLGLVYFEVAKALEFQEILKRVIAILPQNVIFVIQSLGLFNKYNPVLSYNSSKKDILKSLEKSYVPVHNNNKTHRADLLILHKMYGTEKVPEHMMVQSYIINALKAHGIEVLKCPTDMPFKYYDFISEDLQDLFKITATKHVSKREEMIMKYLKDITIEKWLQEEHSMALRENKMYEEDLKLEVALDKFMETVKNEGILQDSSIEFEENVFDVEWADSIIFDSPNVSSRNPTSKQQLV